MKRRLGETVEETEIEADGAEDEETETDGKEGKEGKGKGKGKRKGGKPGTTTIKKAKKEKVEAVYF